MKPLNVASKHLVSLSASGYGYCISTEKHCEFGVGVYRVNLQGCVLSIFESGLAVVFPNESVNVFYRDVSKIISNLSAAVFSKASEAQDVNVLVPLEIVFLDEVVVLEVQLLVYSRLLIVLNEFWRNFKV